MALSRVTFVDPDFQDGVRQVASGEQVQRKLNALQDAWNALVGTKVEAGDLSTALAATVSGYRSVVPTAQTTTSATYTVLTTPDRVSSVVVPTNAVLRIGFQAAWKVSSLATIGAAIFIGTNQLKIATSGSSAPVVQEANGSASGDIYFPLHTTPTGLLLPSWAGAYSGDVTTGQVLGSDRGGGEVIVQGLAAGTYDVGVRFKTSAGTLTVRDRKLVVRLDA